jgi:transposase
MGEDQHGIYPYTYLLDVLQRVSEHSQSDIQQLTPKLWTKHFGDNPLRSDLEI